MTTTLVLTPLVRGLTTYTTYAYASAYGGLGYGEIAFAEAQLYVATETVGETLVLTPLPHTP